MPLFLVPFKYLIAYFAAQMWPGDGLQVCLLRIEVMVARPGLVAPDSQRSEPTSVFIR